MGYLFTLNTFTMQTNRIYTKDNELEKDYWTGIEWEDDKMPLEDFFDENEEDFLLYDTCFFVDNKWVEGKIAFHFTDRRIWVQYLTANLETKSCTVDFARRHAKQFFADYDRARRIFKKAKKKLEKPKAKPITINTFVKKQKNRKTQQSLSFS